MAIIFRLYYFNRSAGRMPNEKLKLIAEEDEFLNLKQFVVVASVDE